MGILGLIAMVKAALIRSKPEKIQVDEPVSGVTRSSSVGSTNKYREGINFQVGIWRGLTHIQF